ncbi:MAG: hypothetical protein ACE5GM_00220 [bacterium]
MASLQKRRKDLSRELEDLKDSIPVSSTDP